MTNQTQQNFIDRANLWLRRAELPTHTRTVAVLAYLVQQVKLSDLPANNHALQRAEHLLNHYDPALQRLPD